MAIAQGLSIYVNGFNLGCAFKEFSPTAEVEVLDSTTLCRTSRTYAQGFKMGNATASGIWDYDQTNADEIHNILTSAFENGTENIITSSLATLAVGGDAIMMNAIETSWAINPELGQLIMCNADFQANNGVYFGKWIFSNSVASTTTNGAGQDNAASSANGGFVQVHYQASTASAGTMILQHSTDNSSWADLATISLSGTTDSDSAFVSGTVNRYVRARCTATGGTATFQVAFVRR